MHKVITFLFLETFCFSNINRILVQVKTIKLDAIHSTNSFLKDLCKQETQYDPVLVVAEEQTNGRGQQGNAWLSKRGQSLTFSIFRRFEALELRDQFLIAQAVSLGIKKSLEQLGVSDVKVKWPNDIMSDSKKICGILIENTVTSGHIKGSVIGIGVNVNESDLTHIPNATSMRLTSGMEYKLEDVLDSIVSNIMEETNRISVIQPSTIHSEYEQVLFRKDKVQAFEDAEKNCFNGIIRGVNPTGELEVERENEVMSTFRMKELKMLF